jgi:hypothetical protein
MHENSHNAPNFSFIAQSLELYNCDYLANVCLYKLYGNKEWVCSTCSINLEYSMLTRYKYVLTDILTMFNSEHY